MNKHNKNNQSDTTCQSVEQIMEKINEIYSECKNIEYKANWCWCNSVECIEFSLIKNTESQIKQMKIDLINYLPGLGFTWEQIRVTRREPIFNVDESQSLTEQLHIISGIAHDLVRSIEKLLRLKK